MPCNNLLCHLHGCLIAGDGSDEEDADDPESPGKGKKGKRGTEAAGRSSGKFKGKSLTASAKAALAASKKPPVSKFAALRHSVYKALFGWLDPKFKRNGKKLLTSNSVLWRFMVRSRMCCWLFDMVCYNCVACTSATCRGRVWQRSCLCAVATCWVAFMIRSHGVRVLSLCLQVPLLLWVAAVVVVFAVSQNSLKGLQVKADSHECH
jgi:hypothetical protein